ncbi:MAG: type I methionyl aminopeptidase [bacterium]|nr:type I methionyl aminopeptidase [bacterium]
MTVENQADLAGLIEIGRIVGLTIQHMIEHLKPGMTTGELDAIGAEFLKKHGARSAPILAYKFPGTTCISINDEAAHGIPGSRVIKPGDLVNVDVSAEKNGYWADAGMSLGVPPITAEQQRMLDSCKRALEIAIENARAGVRAAEIGKAVEKYIRERGFNTIEELGGHGVGRHIHEKPSIPNHFAKRNRDVLKEGMVVTLEPFVTNGARHVNTDPDGWTLRTTDGSFSVQMEHTVIITKNRPILVTQV